MEEVRHGVPSLTFLYIRSSPSPQVFSVLSALLQSAKEVKFHHTNRKGYLPAKPGKHADPPDKTTVLYQSLSPANSAEWQCSIQRAMAWCKPMACLYQQVQHKLNINPW